MYGYFACEHGTLLSFTTKGVIQGTALGLEGPEGTLDPLSECPSLLSLSSIIWFLYNCLTILVNLQRHSRTLAGVYQEGAGNIESIYLAQLVSEARPPGSRRTGRRDEGYRTSCKTGR